MAKEVILSPLAFNNYENIIKYLIENWGLTVAEDFIDRFEVTCNSLANNPGIYSFVDKVKRIQKCVVTKHNVVYFKVDKENIKILIVFDTRQNPDKLLLLL